MPPSPKKSPAAVANGVATTSSHGNGTMTIPIANGHTKKGPTAMANGDRSVETHESPKHQLEKKRSRELKNFSNVFPTMKHDNLHHIGLSTTSQLEKDFGDVKAVCLMGSPERAKIFCESVLNQLHPNVADNKIELKPLGANQERCSLYKAGPVLAISHGMGNPSCLIFLNEIAKLMYYARVDFNELKFVRLGTSGGIGIEPGTVVITDQTVDGTLSYGFEHTSLGKKQRFSTKSDTNLNEQIIEASERTGLSPKLKKRNLGRGFAVYNLDQEFKIVTGTTLCADDFYETQGRRDGALQPWYTEEEKLEFLRKANKERGVVNIEMESACVLSFFRRLGCPAAVVAVTLLDRLKGDQIQDNPATVQRHSLHAPAVVLSWLATHYLS